MPASQHLEWLRLVDVSGPFLSPTVLDDLLTQGLLGIPTPLRQSLRQAHEEWRDAVDLGDRQLPALHKAWIAHVLRVGLDWSDRELLAGDDPAWRHLVEEHGVELRPDFALIGSDRAPLAFVQVLPPDGDPGKPPTRDRWAANSIDRMVHLCRAKQVRVGLITDGERWVVVNAPIGSTSGWATWLARIWWQEPQTFQAFRTLLEVRRWFGPADQALPGLLEASAEAHDEITTTLGEQVRQAVEAIIQALDRLNRDQGGRLLAGVSERQLYEAGLTVMMRLVVLLCAEERGLLPVEEPLYQESYAISTLRAQLDALPDEVLERQHSAWSRILALVRGVYGGIAHDRLRLPALGGSIFDPDRYPFLEGRTDGTTWREVPAAPLLIDDRVVLYLLRSLQILESKAGAQLLSFRALDVEQIGHVYEGLLEHTVLRMTEPALGLTGSPKIPTPCVPLVELETARQRGVQILADLVAERTGRQARTIVNELAAEPDAALRAAVIRASSGDADLARRTMPFAGLLRCDARGERLVYGKGSVLVTGGADRRETGSHYTPRHLAEQIAAKTLEPLCYTGPAEGHPREKWTLHAPERLLDLKVCDPAMGSGAFLVAGCRYLAERLVEAWRQAEDAGKRITEDGSVHDDLGSAEPMPVDADERMTRARRLVAERCIYGVDINPVAVELAKISLWLVTWAKGRPFGFLDHRLKSGDSLLGVINLDQLVQMRLVPAACHQETIFTKSIRDAVNESIKIRALMTKRNIRNIADVQDLNRNADACDRIMAFGSTMANALIGASFASIGKSNDLVKSSERLVFDGVRAMNGDIDELKRISSQASEQLRIESQGNDPRVAFHWPLQYPEVFCQGKGGFDGIIGNPPFLGGRKIRGALGGNYLSYLTSFIGSHSSGNADLCAYFFIRSFELLDQLGACGLIASNTIAEGDTRRTGLDYILSRGGRIFSANDDFPWPGSASITISMVHFTKTCREIPCLLSGRAVDVITASLRTEVIAEKAVEIPGNADMCFQGSVLAAKGFILDRETAEKLILEDKKNADVIQPYFTGDEVFNLPSLSPLRYVINFRNWSIDRAKAYPGPFSIVERDVRPIRMKVNRKAHRELWWQYGDKRTSLYSLLGKISKAIVQTHHTKYLSPQFVETGPVFSHSMVVFPSENYWLYCLLNSFVHEAWARENGSSIGTGLRYTPTDCFYTFPLIPPEKTPRIAEMGRLLEKSRSIFRSGRNCSVNQMLDLMHSPDSNENDVVSLRNIEKEMTIAVLDAYGWSDLGETLEFNEIHRLPDGCRIRFAPPSAVWDEVARRLLKLNSELGLSRCAITRGRHCHSEEHS